MANKVTLSASITRHYGAVSACFGAEMEFEVSAGNTVGQSYYKLISLIHHEFDQYEADQLKHEKPLHSSDRPAAAAPPAAPQWFWAIKLIRDIVKGKEHFYILTKESKYAKHGVPCYPEFLKEFNLIDQLNGKTELIFAPGVQVSVDASGKYTKANDLRTVKAR